jgi:hypothetical protein
MRRIRRIWKNHTEKKEQQENEKDIKTQERPGARLKK